MSTDNKKTEAKPAPIAHKPPPGMSRVVVDMPQFKPEPFSEREQPGSPVLVYAGAPIYGEVLSMRNFGPMIDEATGQPKISRAGEVVDQVALVVKLYEPTMTIDREGKPVKSAKDDTVLWFATTKAWQAICVALRIDAATITERNEKLSHAINDGEYGFTIWALPTRLVPFEDDQKMWSYDILVGDQPVKRVGAAGLSRFFSQGAQHRAALTEPAPAEITNGRHTTTLPAAAR